MRSAFSVRSDSQFPDIHFSKSLDIGAVRLTEKFISHQPISKIERDATEAWIDTAIESILDSIEVKRIDQIIAVAGTPSALVAATLGQFDAERVHGFVLDEAALRKWCETLADTTVEYKINSLGLDKGRADILFVGATILHRLLLLTSKKQMKVSIKGVRYGIAVDLLSRS
ncbi:MAG: hypothetical protein EOP06_29650 [Proteobacteria bacterium]|nr:MAG: hypothetical protein EOP06_29650 [Pseudomonadota bacterium]